jgi:Tfp pilus assembly protein PilP
MSLAVFFFFALASFAQAQEANESPQGEPPQSAPVQPAPTDGPLPPPPRAPENEGYTFNPSNLKRDPFTPPEVTPQDELAKLPEAERFDLREMKLVAILTGMGTPQALISIPGGKSIIVQTGDKIGKRNGRIVKITSSEVEIKEQFKDFQGRPKEQQTSLVIAE